jgi:hypothetical protein
MVKGRKECVGEKDERGRAVKRSRRVAPIVQEDSSQSPKSNFDIRPPIPPPACKQVASRQGRYCECPSPYGSPIIGDPSELILPGGGGAYPISPPTPIPDPGGGGTLLCNKLSVGENGVVNNGGLAPSSNLSGIWYMGIGRSRKGRKEGEKGPNKSPEDMAVKEGTYD